MSILIEKPSVLRDRLVKLSGLIENRHADSKVSLRQLKNKQERVIESLEFDNYINDYLSDEYGNKRRITVRGKPEVHKDLVSAALPFVADKYFNNKLIAYLLDGDSPTGVPYVIVNTRQSIGATFDDFEIDVAEHYVLKYNHDTEEHIAYSKLNNATNVLKSRLTFVKNLIVKLDRRKELETLGVANQIHLTDQAMARLVTCFKAYEG